MFEKRYKILFMRKEYSTMYCVGILKTDDIPYVVRYKGKSYNIKVEFPTFSETKTKIYFIDFDSGNQMKFEDIKAMLNPNEADLLFSNHLIKELTAGAIADKREKLINMILGGIIGALMAALAMFMYMNNKIEEIYASFTPSVVLP